MLQDAGSGLTTFVPALRLYARVLCGDPGTGDGLVAWSLHRADELARREAAEKCRFIWLLSTLRCLHHTGMLDQASNVPCPREIPGQAEIARLMALPQAEREALTLVRILGCTRDDAARVMEISRSQLDHLVAVACLHADEMPLGTA